MKRSTTIVSLFGLGVISAVAPLASAALDQSSSAQEKTPAQDDGAKAEKSADKKDEKPQLTGRVLFEGDLPAVKPLAVPAGAAAGCCPDGGNVNSDDLSLLISKDRGIKNVVVSIKVEGAKVEIPKEPFILDQKGCRFLPHVLAVPKGAKVAFLNSDETSHNVHLKCVLNDPLNQTVIAGKRIERVFGEAESVVVACDMHTWMKSFVYVTDATHYTMTDADGAFSLKGLPPGKHTVKFWHETLGGSKTAEVTVAEDGTVAEPLEVKLAKKKKKSRGRRKR